jgi:hypothetical protein
MPAVVVHATSASVRAEVAISFISRVEVPAGSTVVIVAPPALISLSCGSTYTTYSSVPGTLGQLQDCEEIPARLTNNSRALVRMRLDSILPPAEHLAIIPGETPAADPSSTENVFDVLIAGPDGQNLDTALRVPGERVVQGLRASVWPFWWTQALNGVTSSAVTLPLEILNDAEVPVYAVVVVFPSEASLGILPGTGVEVSAAIGRNPRSAGFQVETNGNVTSFTLRFGDGGLWRNGVYLIRFTITVPEQQPRLNLWRVGLCSELVMELESLCSLGPAPWDDQGAAVLTVFAQPGFDPLTRPTQLALPSVAGARPLASPPSSWTRATLLLLLLGLTMRPLASVRLS